MIFTQTKAHILNTNIIIFLFISANNNTFAYIQTNIIQL